MRCSLQSDVDLGWDLSADGLNKDTDNPADCYLSNSAAKFTFFRVTFGKQSGIEQPLRLPPLCEESSFFLHCFQCYFYYIMVVLWLESSIWLKRG